MPRSVTLLASDTNETELRLRVGYEDQVSRNYSLTPTCAVKRLVQPTPCKTQRMRASLREQTLPFLQKIDLENNNIKVHIYQSK